MNYKLVKNIFLYGIGDFIVTGVTAFLLIPLYLKFLSTEDYGILNILNNNGTILTYIFQFGLVSAFSRLYFLRKNENTENTYINAILVFHILYSSALFILLYFFGEEIFKILSPSIKNTKLFLFPIGIAFLSFIPALYYVLARMEQKVFVFVSYQVATVSLLLAFIAIHIFFFKLDLNGIISSFIYTYIIIWLIVVITFLKNFSFKIESQDIIDTVKFAMPIFVGYIAYFLMSRYSLIILQKYISLKEIGLYSLAQQIAMIPTFISIAVSKALQPNIFSSNSDEELQRKSQSIDNVYKIFMIWIVGCLILSVDSIAHLFFADKYEHVVLNLQFLLIINLVYNFTLVENSILLYKIKSNILLMITVSGSLANVLLSNWLIVHFSINGVLASMLLSYCLTFCLECYYSRRFIKYRYDAPKIVVSLSLVILFMIIKYFYGYNGILVNIYKIIGILLLTLLLYLSVKNLKKQPIEQV